MPDASFVQSSFLAGEWSPYAQGRIDLPQYKTALALCMNAFPVEEGACPRRPGFAFAATTRLGNAGRVLPFNFTDVAPFTIELTQSHLRMFQGRGLVFDSAQGVIDISNETPAIVTVAGSETWATGDQVQFLFQSVTSVADGAILRNRQLTITVIDPEHFSLADGITGAPVDGATVNWDPTQASAQVAHVLDLPTPYVGEDWESVRRVQAADLGVNDENVALLLQGKYKPQSLETIVDAAAPNFTPFTLTPQDFNDGPYTDIAPGAVITPNALSGSITLTISYTAWSSTTAYTVGEFASFGGSNYQSINITNIGNEPDTSPTFWALVNVGAAVGTNGFVATDVGRSIRLLSEPLEWDTGTSYSAGDSVKFNDGYYTAVNGNAGEEPDTNLTDWLPTNSPNVYTWTWGKITSVVSANQVVISLFGSTIDGQVANLLYTNPITTWQIGTYSDTTGWPSCGIYYESRLWLSGAVPNRVDGSNSNDFFNFSPTAPDGTVGDANAVNATFDSDDENAIYWIEPSSQGLVAGTKNGEWLIQASALNDPITPTSIQAHRVTKVGCFNQIPVHTPLTMVFINRYQRMLFEYFPDVFSGKLTAPNLNVYSKHLTVTNCEEIGYQSELAPIIWARMGDGSLAGWTYRRTTAFASEEPKFVGAHRHVLGSGRIVESICVGPTPDQTSDTPIIVTNDPTTGIRHVEMGTQLLDPLSPLTQAWFVDDSVTPSGMIVTATGVQIYGLWHLNGNTVSVVIGGLDCGDFAIANGTVFVPFQSDPGKFLTAAYLQSISGSSYGDLAVPLDQSVTVTPNQTTSPQTIEEFVLPNTNTTGVSGPQIVVNFSGGYALFRASPGAGDGMRKVDVNSGQQIADATMAQIQNGVAPAPPAFALGWTQGLDGFIYMQDLSGNTDRILKINSTTLHCVATFGTPSSSFTPGPAGIPIADSVAACFAGANYLVLGCDTSAGSVAITVLNTDTMAWVTGSTSTNLSETGVSLCTGVSGSSFGTVYSIGVPAAFDTTPASTHLYVTSIQPNGVGLVPTIITTQQAEIAARAIDPTWPYFDFIAGPCRDQTDGNILVGFQNTSTPGLTNTAYFCKLRESDGTLMWKIPVAYLPDTWGMQNSNAVGGVFAWMGGGISPRTVFVVNTGTGTLSTFQVSGVQPAGAQVFDSVSGTLTLFSTYTEAAGTPTPTIGSPGGWVDQFSRLTAGGIFFGSTSSTQRYTLPAVVGYTYTTECITLRPADQRDTGSANGPAQGKTRRSHMYSLLLAGVVSGSLYIGTLFSKLRPAVLKTPGGIVLDSKTLYSGVHWDTLEDDYNFEGGLRWKITRPLPAPVVSIGGFINTQDR